MLTLEIIRNKLTRYKYIHNNHIQTLRTATLFIFEIPKAKRVGVKVKTMSHTLFKFL